VLAAYSPYHNIRQGAEYPPVLISTGDHDDRVVPSHSFKYTAALQEAAGGQSPILLRVGREAGHGAGKPIYYWVEEAADLLSFLKQELSD
jgi:prolyl oligopeptidase